MENLHKISKLQQRYSLGSKQSIYNRINGLGIVPPQKGYVSSEQLDLLDRLDKHLRSGGTFDDFPIQPEVEVEPMEIQAMESAPQQERVEDLYLRTFDWMGGIIEQMIAQRQSDSVLERFEQLQKAAQMGWMLPTSAIASLIGIKPRGQRVEYGNFSILRCDKRIGREAAWMIKLSVNTVVSNQKDTDNQIDY